jgi:hypothetical protein
MSVDEMNSVIAKYQSSLCEKTGIVMFSESGPAGMSVIHAMAKAITELEERIKQIESR